MAGTPKYPPLISIVPLPDPPPELQSLVPVPPSEASSPPAVPDTQAERPQESAEALSTPDTEQKPPEVLPEEDSEAVDADAGEPASESLSEKNDADPSPDASFETAEAVTEEAFPDADAKAAPVPSPVASDKPKKRKPTERSTLRKNRLLFLLLSTLILLVALYSPQIFPTLYENTVTILTQIGILEEPVEEPFEPFVLTDEILSEQAVLIDLESGQILAEKDAETPVAPASMTKIMTLMTAVEQIEDLDDTFTMTQTILNTTYDNDLSIAGFVHGETVPIRDLLYGLILPSGADASFALSSYLGELDIPESERSFSEFMNAKAAHYGLSSVHFSNSTGMFEETHQASVHDVAVMLWFAMQDDICRDVLTSVKYTTTKTEQHPEGIELTNYFLVKVAEEDCGNLEVIAAKTGFVDESGRCAASYAVDETGHAYICVTAKTDSYEQVITDHAMLYANFIPESSTESP